MIIPEHDCWLLLRLNGLPLLKTPKVYANTLRLKCRMGHHKLLSKQKKLTCTRLFDQTSVDL
jgi:hypothetical protein